MLGAAFGIVATHVFPNLSSGYDAYTIVGMGAVAGAVLAVPIVVTLLRRRARWGVAALVAVLLLGAGTVATRMLPDAAGAGTPLTVLTANVYDGEASVHALAALVADERPDLVSLPEAGADYRARLAPLVEPLGYRLRPVVVDQDATKESFLPEFLEPVVDCSRPRLRRVRRRS